MIESIREIIMWACLSALAAILLFALMRFSLPRLRKVASSIPVAIVAMCAVVVGGVKNLMTNSIFGHDDAAPYGDIVAATVYTGESVTNVPSFGSSSVASNFGTNSFVLVLAHPAGSSAGFSSLEHFWYRDSQKEQWNNFMDVPDVQAMSDISYSEGGTNFVAVACGGTNMFKHAYHYYGDDLPPVYIEVEGGITLDRVDMTSKKMSITYSVDPSAMIGNGVVVIEYEGINQYGNWSGTWTPIRVVEAAAGTHTEEFVGFYVSKRRRYRMKLQMEVSE